jgi:hypothetical protein
VPPGLDRSAEPGAQAFDRVGRADDSADLRVEVEEGRELCLGVVPQLDDRWIAVFSRVTELDEPVKRSGLRGRLVDGLEIAGDPRPILGAGIPKAVA